MFPVFPPVLYITSTVAHRRSVATDCYRLFVTACRPCRTVLDGWHAGAFGLRLTGDCPRLASLGSDGRLAALASATLTSPPKKFFVCVYTLGL